MSNLWKEVTSWLSDATKSAIKETEDLARKGHLKLEILGINTALHDKFAALGGVVYELMKAAQTSSIRSDTQVKKLTLEIAELETQLHAKKSKEKKASSPKQSANKPAVNSTKKKTITAAKSSQKSTVQKKSTKTSSTTNKTGTTKTSSSRGKK